jgi:hypothetical protein
MLTYCLKKASLFFVVFFVFATGVAAPPIASVLYDNKKEPSTALLNVLTHFGIEEKTWPNIVQATQEKWLRGSGKERWDVHEISTQNSYKNYALFSSINMTKTFESTLSLYEDALILGGTLQNVRARFYFLKQEWERGMRFKNLFILTGDRPLNPSFEGEKELIEQKYCPYPFRKEWKFEGVFPKNETEMTQLVFDQLDLPKEWRSMHVIFVDAPQNQGKRPNTKDTYVKWLAMNPPEGKILIVSDQPFLGRQDSLARKILPNRYEIETVGVGFSFEEFKNEKKALSILLDDLARWIYTEQLGD